MYLLRLRKSLSSVAIFDVKPVVVTFFHRGQCQCDLEKSKSKQLYNMADNPVDCDFPVWGLLPKKETGVVSFLNKYNIYDGRNTVIAILDSGVDPAATGLQVTSTGDIKVIERFDCSGCGDVDTSAVVQLKDGIITGLTSRKLVVPSTWKNPSGNWHIGLLYPFSLYPTKLKERVQEHRKEHQWDVYHKTALAKAHKDLQEFEQKKGGSTTLSPEDKILKEELEARVEILQTADRKYVDAGPTYDCVLFNDGTVWRAAIDTTEEGNLAQGILLGEYSATHEHTHLTPLDQMTVSINVHGNGNLLEVTGMCSTHGTHVAAIAAANFPEEPDKNGIAPGAKIVSLTIGDSRLGSMETGTALVRACIKVMELSKKMKIDVINMSYGEHAHWSNSGRVGEMICEVVNRYGATWIVSAGNHGPALCTVGSPPDIAQSTLIGVGAYVSPDMMSAAYSMRARLPSTAFSWSSRGPAADGAAGVAVVAPGGAITSVARFTLRGTQLLNGTSMAAPHVAGAVAVLISGLKAQSIPFSPYSIKRALENSATRLPNVEPWAQGCGLLNVEKAFELLTSYRDQPEQDVMFAIKCGNANAKGIHLRGRYQDSPKDIGVSVEPQFLMDCEDMEDTSTLSKKIDFNLRLSLTCNASWVHHSSYLDLMNVDRPFSVRVDTSALPPGAHFTSIQGYDVRCIEKGPVFRIPITAVQAEPLQVDTAGAPTLNQTSATFKPGTIKRHFVIVPDEATWAVLRLRTTEKEKNGRFLVHSMQLMPRQNCKSHEYQKLVTVHCQSETTLPFQVIGGVMLEVAIAKYWANVGDVTVDYTLEFRGIKPNFGSTLTFHGATGLQNIYVSTLRLEECQPSAQLKHSESVLRPSDSKLQPLTERDVIPRNRHIYQLLNTYNFHLAKGTEVSPNVALLSDMLYESEFESQMWMIFNSNKQLMGVGDAYPSKYSVKLEKGDYVLRLSVRHEQRAHLEKMNDLPIILQQRLPQALTLDCYSTHAHALTGGKKFSGAQIPQGTILPLYLTALPSDKISRSHWTLGHLLTGSITLAKDELGKKVDTYMLKYVIPEMPKRNSTVGTNGKDKEKAKTEDFGEALKEFKTSWLAKLDGEKLDQLYEELLEAYPDFPGLHIAYLNSVDSSTDPRKLPHAKTSPTVTVEWCEKIKAISDKVISKIDQDKLLAQIGLKNDTRPDAQKIKQDIDKQRGNLLDAMCRRGTAICRLHALSSDASGDSVAAIQSNMNNLLKFTDVTDNKVIQYGVWHNFTLKNWGTALKLLNKMQEERPSKEIEERLGEVYNELEWPFLVNVTYRALPVKYPSGYRLF